MVIAVTVEGLLVRALIVFFGSDASKILSAKSMSSSVGLSPTETKAMFKACGSRRNHNDLMMLGSKVSPAVCFMSRNSAEGFRSPSSALSSNASSRLLSEAECLEINIFLRVVYLSFVGGWAIMSITDSQVSAGNALIVRQYLVSSLLQLV